MTKRPQPRDTSIAYPGSLAPLANLPAISNTPRPEHSGSVQQILSSMLVHAG
jgi:hypothetical protein